MKIQRTKNTARNMMWGVFNNLVKMLLPFVARTILLKLLGEQYLGLNGLFSSILQVLNLADLGFGTAIVYSMYKPIAEDNKDAICALLAMYKKIYRVIGGVVLTIGLCLLPFLKYFIKGDIPDDVNIYLIYLIYLGNTVISYWMFAYKTSLLSAHQRNDMTMKIHTVLLFVQYGLQIGLLLIVKNYYLYLIVLPFITMLTNIATAMVVKKLYPEYICRGQVSDDVKKGIKKQVGGLFISKVCGVTRNALDNVFISSFIGLTAVSIYGNYYYILNAVHGLLSVIGQSMLGGVGNSIAKESKEKNFVDFNRLNFLYAWLSGWCACCMLCIYQHFMEIWVGSKFLFPFSTMVLLCVFFYAMTMTDIKNVYVDACGLWWQNRVRSILEAVSNFVLHIILGYFFGIWGIIGATLITIVTINFIYGNYILFKHYFKNESLKLYLLKHLGYLTVTAIVTVITYIVCSLLPKTGFIALIGKAAICVVLPNVLFLLFYCQTKVFAQAKPLVINIIRGFMKKLHLIR